MLKQLFEDNPRRCASVFGGSLLLMVAAIALLNFIVNPMAQYSTNFFEPMVQTSRKQKIALEASLPTRPQGLVLGSSRVMKIEPDYLQGLTGKTFFNAGVNYGKPEDFLAWLRYYHEKYNRYPEIVLIGIDPSSLSSEEPTDARLMATKELVVHTGDSITLKDRLHTWTDLLAWDHTKRSAKSILHHLRAKEKPPQIEHYRHDGLLVYDQREKEIQDGTYDLAGPIKFNQGEYLPRYAGFKNLSAARKETLSAIAKICQENDTRLTVFITPLHPELESFLTARSDYQKWRDDVNQYLSELSQSYHFEYHDLACIEAFDGDPNQFVDGTHPLESNTRRMVDVLFSNEEFVSHNAVQ